MNKEEQESENQPKESRRDFFLKSLTVVAAAAGACGVSCGCNQADGSSVSEDETIKLLSPDGELIEVKKSQINPSMPNMHHHKSLTGDEARMGIPGRKFVMVIDLGKCKNARKCITACQKMHHLPEEKEWLQVKMMKDSDQAAPYWFPKTCFHCDNPPCVKVCPVNATFKRQDGLVLIDNDRCIGCKFCMAACPYSTRVFNWGEPEPLANLDVPYSPETSVPSQIGTVEKCDFCPDMAREGKLPDCVTACPNGVFYFGDENEDTVTNGSETIRFSQLIKDRAGYRYMEELGTEPRVYYLPPYNRMFPVERGLKDVSDETKELYKDLLD